MKSPKRIATRKGKAAGFSRHSPLTSRRASLVFSTPWGWMGVAESETGLVTIVLPQNSKAAVAADLRAHTPASFEEGSSARLRRARTQLREYLAGTRTTFDLPLDLSRGTSFQRRVWEQLRSVPYGQLLSYQGLACRVGGRQYARAIGGAVGANPLPIVVPCHRIVAHDASIGGFSCGLPAKRKLLELEGTLAQLAQVRGAGHKVSGR